MDLILLTTMLDESRNENRLDEIWITQAYTLLRHYVSLTILALQKIMLKIVRKTQKISGGRFITLLMG